MNDYDKTIHNNPDAQAWAKLFIETVRQQQLCLEDLDEGLMIGWFANAMMAMHDYIKSENTAIIAGVCQQQKIATVISKDESTATITGVWEQPAAYLCEFFADPGHTFLSFEPVQSGTNQPLYAYPPMLQHSKEQ